jgi:steroid delta-isomerase
MSSGLTQNEMKDALATYVASFAKHDVDALVDLFAEDAVIHDPVGHEPVTNTTTVRDFFTRVLTNVYDARLDGPIRGSEGNAAAFSFELSIRRPDGTEGIVRAVDIMTFNKDGKVILMQAYHGPDDRIFPKPQD